MRSNSFIYSFKIWLTALFIAPALNLVVDNVMRRQLENGIGQVVLDQFCLYLLFVLFGGITSFLTWLLLFLVIQIVVKGVPVIAYPKYIIMVAGVLLTIGTFILCWDGCFI